MAFSAAATAAAPPAPRFELRYFPLLAKGAGPALVAEHSGLPWAGSGSLGFSIEREWPALKPSAPFGQLPLLTVLDDRGEGRSFTIAQSTAIINSIARLAGTQGTSEADVAMSQQLLAEGESAPPRPPALSTRREKSCATCQSPRRLPSRSLASPPPPRSY